MKTLKKLLANNEEIDLRKVFPEAIDAVTQLISRKLSII
jgi:tagatose 1,6-diphosphate aldolase GatY/KbaY